MVVHCDIVSVSKSQISTTLAEIKCIVQFKIAVSEIKLIRSRLFVRPSAYINRLTAHSPIYQSVNISQSENQ